MPKIVSKNYLTRDVDVLVSGIKQKLKLSNFNKEKSRNVDHQTIIRLSPYELRTQKSYKESYKTEDEDDPFLKLRQLVEQGRLINEAVKKLQTMNFDDLSNNESDSYKEDDDDVHDRYRIRRAHYSYDSEDEPIPGVYNPPSDL